MKRVPRVMTVIVSLSATLVRIAPAQAQSPAPSSVTVPDSGSGTDAGANARSGVLAVREELDRLKEEFATVRQKYR